MCIPFACHRGCPHPACPLAHDPIKDYGELDDAVELWVLECGGIKSWGTKETARLPERAKGLRDSKLAKERKEVANGTAVGKAKRENARAAGDADPAGAAQDPKGTGKGGGKDNPKGGKKDGRGRGGGGNEFRAKGLSEYNVPQLLARNDLKDFQPTEQEQELRLLLASQSQGDWLQGSEKPGTALAWDRLPDTVTAPRLSSIQSVDAALQAESALASILKDESALETVLKNKAANHHEDQESYTFQGILEDIASFGAGVVSRDAARVLDMWGARAGSTLDTSTQVVLHAPIPCSSQPGCAAGILEWPSGKWVFLDFGDILHVPRAAALQWVGCPEQESATMQEGNQCVLIHLAAAAEMRRQRLATQRITEL